MADYREISQIYAQGAIKSVILANSGGALAIVSQLAALKSEFNSGVIAALLMIYMFGATLGIASWIFAFISTRYVDRTNRDEEEDYSKANKFQLIATIMIFLSLFSFFISAPIISLSLFY